MEIKRIAIKKSSRFRTFNLPTSWLREQAPRNGDVLVIEKDDARLILHIERK